MRLSGPVKVFTEGEFLLRQGDDRSGHVMMLQTGAARVVAATAHGTEVLLGIRRPGDVLGEMRFLCDMPRTASVLAVGRVRVQVLEREAMCRLLRRWPHLAVLMARCLAERLQWSDKRRTDAGLVVIVRVCRVLLELAEAVGGYRLGRDAAGAGPIVVAVTQRELGRLAGAAEVSVQRALRVLQARGWLERRYGRVTLLRPDGIRAALLSGSLDL